jgi:hypothetical protein
MYAVVLISYQGDELRCPYTVAGAAQFNCKPLSPDAGQLISCYSAQEPYTWHVKVKVPNNRPEGPEVCV